MFKPKAFQSKQPLKARNRESGNAIVIVLVLLVAVAVGVLAYMSGALTGGDEGNQTGAAVAESTPAAGDNTAAAGENPVEPGNPIVAKVNGQDITRLDVFNFIQTLPEQTRQLPVQQLFPIAVEQVVNSQIVEVKTKGINLDNDPEVQKQMELAKENIVRGVYIQKLVNNKMTEERLKTAYEQYKTSFPSIDEVKASHILVKDESAAKDLIKKLDEGADFAELAKANSSDATAAKGGELGYFAQTDVVPPFAEASFKTEPGTYTKKPVKSDFGYHIIKVEDKRKRPPAEFEVAKPYLEAQLRRVVLDELIQEWREAAKIERFDINGDPIEPSAGEETPAAAPAPAAEPAKADEATKPE